MGNIIFRVNIAFCTFTQWGTASADSWVGDLLNVFWKSAGSETGTILNLKMILLQ